VFPSASTSHAALEAAAAAAASALETGAVSGCVTTTSGSKGVRLICLMPCSSAKSVMVKRVGWKMASTARTSAE